MAKNFLRGAKRFQTMSNSLQLYPTDFSRGAKSFAGGFSSLCPPLVTGLLTIPIISRFMYCNNKTKFWMYQGQSTISKTTRCCGDFSDDRTLRPYDYTRSACCKGKIFDYGKSSLAFIKCAQFHEQIRRNVLVSLVKVNLLNCLMRVIHHILNRRTCFSSYGAETCAPVCFVCWLVICYNVWALRVIYHPWQSSFTVC